MIQHKIVLLGSFICLVGLIFFVGETMTLFCHLDIQTSMNPCYDYETDKINYDPPTTQILIIGIMSIVALFVLVCFIITFSILQLIMLLIFDIEGIQNYIRLMIISIITLPICGYVIYNYSIISGILLYIVFPSFVELILEKIGILSKYKIFHVISDNLNI